MAYVDGAYAGHGTKRRVVFGLVALAAVSFAVGWARNAPPQSGPAGFSFGEAEPGVLIARPVAELPPEPLLQAKTEPRPSRPAPRAKPAPPPEVLPEVPLIATVESPLAAPSADVAASQAAASAPQPASPAPPADPPV